jgi:hypothetical protein
MEAWSIYLEEFRQRGEAASRQQFGRNELLSEAAHDAYQVTSDRMTREHGWSDEHALVVMRGLNGAVSEWLRAGGADWGKLAEELQRREAELLTGFGDGAGTPRRADADAGRGASGGLPGGT